MAATTDTTASRLCPDLRRDILNGEADIRAARNLAIAAETITQRQDFDRLALAFLAGELHDRVQRIVEHWEALAAAYVAPNAGA